VPTFQSLIPNRQALEGMWSDMLSHQLPVLPPLSDFWDALPEIFSWIMSSAPVPQRALIQHGSGEIAIRSRVLPMGVPLHSRSTLEIIRFAAANHLCVDLRYDGSLRRIEPYSLRQTAEGYFVLHAIRSDSEEHRSYRVDRMQGATVTSQVFTPRYMVELNSTGPLTVARAEHAARSQKHTSRANPPLSMHGVRKGIQQEKYEWLPESSQEPSRSSVLRAVWRVHTHEVLGQEIRDGRHLLS